MILTQITGIQGKAELHVEFDTYDSGGIDWDGEECDTAWGSGDCDIKLTLCIDAGARYVLRQFPLQ